MVELQGTSNSGTYTVTDPGPSPKLQRDLSYTSAPRPHDGGVLCLSLLK